MAVKNQAKKFHHISSHFTNGLFPAAALFITLFLVTGNIIFEHAALCCLGVGTLAAPVVYSCGLADWTTRFNKRAGKIFKRKQLFGAILIVVTLIFFCVRLYFGDSFLLTPYKFVYAGCVYLITGIVGYLGYMGGRFIV